LESKIRVINLLLYLFNCSDVNKIYIVSHAVTAIIFIFVIANNNSGYSSEP